MTLLKTGRGPRCTIWGDQPAASSPYFAHTYAICTYIYLHCDPISSSSHKGKYTIHRSCGIYIYIYTYSQENSWKNQLTKSSSIKRGHYLTYLANPNNGLFVWGNHSKLPYIFAVFDLPQNRSFLRTPVKRRQQVGRLPPKPLGSQTQKRLFLDLHVRCLKKGSRNILRKGGLMVMNIMAEFLIKSPI